MLIKLLFGKQIVAIVLTYASKQGLDEFVRDKFYEGVIFLVS